MSLNVYTPNKEEPLNLDLSLFNQNNETPWGFVYPSYFTVLPP